MFISNKYKITGFTAYSLLAVLFILFVHSELDMFNHEDVESHHSHDYCQLVSGAVSNPVFSNQVVKAQLTDFIVFNDLLVDEFIPKHSNHIGLLYDRTYSSLYSIKLNLRNSVFLI